jgi:ribosomal protein L11 methyltransferase
MWRRLRSSCALGRPLMRLSDALFERGALSVSVEDADWPAPTARRPSSGNRMAPPMPATPCGMKASRVIALFDPADDLDRSTALPRSDAGIDDAGFRARKKWPNRIGCALTQSQFEPIRVNERLWIVPSWHDAPDPGCQSISCSTRGWLSAPARTRPPASAWNGCANTARPEASRTRLRLRFRHTRHRRGAPRRRPVLGVDIDDKALVAARDNAEQQRRSALRAAALRNRRWTAKASTSWWPTS